MDVHRAFTSFCDQILVSLNKAQKIPRNGKLTNQRTVAIFGDLVEWYKDDALWTEKFSSHTMSEAVKDPVQARLEGRSALLSNKIEMLKDLQKVLKSAKGPAILLQCDSEDDRLALDQFKVMTLPKTTVAAGKILFDVATIASQLLDTPLDGDSETREVAAVVEVCREHLSLPANLIEYLWATFFPYF